MQFLKFLSSLPASERIALSSQDQDLLCLSARVHPVEIALISEHNCRLALQRGLVVLNPW